MGRSGFHRAARIYRERYKRFWKFGKIKIKQRRVEWDLGKMSNKKGWIGEETYGMSTLGLGEFKINGPEEEIKELLKAIREETPELLTKEQIEN